MPVSADRAHPLIDIRMAIGANLRAILTQFLLKALVISIMDASGGLPLASAALGP